MPNHLAIFPTLPSTNDLAPCREPWDVGVRVSSLARLPAALEEDRRRGVWLQLGMQGTRDAEEYLVRQYDSATTPEDARTLLEALDALETVRRGRRAEWTIPA